MNKIYAQPPQQAISSSYPCEHLASFARSEQSNLTAQDYMEKLKRMEQTSGVWTMKVRLVVMPGSIDVVDPNSGHLVESFPMSSVKDLESVSASVGSAQGRDVILFSTSDQQLHEMHLFQTEKPGNNFVADVQEAKRSINPIKRTYIHTKLPEIGNIEDDARRPEGVGWSRQQASVDYITTSEFSTQQLLDYLFSDIQMFVSHLNQIAQAFENKRKRMTVRSSGLGDGLLSMRCKPPPAKDFFDILQKFKLSFILIAKLKQKICKPNAPELVHFLFKPLMLVVSACSDPREEYSELVRRVDNPLITEEVRNLFENCLDTSETETWIKLGPAWNSTSKQWPEELPLYSPVFLNGWSPPLDWMREILHDSTSARSQSPPMQTKEKFLKDLIAKNAKIYIVKSSKEAANTKELSIEKSEIVEAVAAPDSKNWWKVRNYKSECGFVPKSHLERYMPS
ncbi:hypothetical protein HELRODRAFT_192833 [Helobdella robusta]|uniref:SH3 domain-containing protein n=1 Tax=Helobdella robusta TaxID=6412 RepID=T1FUC3_HELRO|nr:hypothetical protein HELRODRAFT_192833 [Helobdella robusta]ESN99877.1 hypothetical protein HELRODRAFT_192833 [Helobdella robusta]